MNLASASRPPFGPLAEILSRRRICRAVHIADIALDVALRAILPIDDLLPIGTSHSFVGAATGLADQRHRHVVVG